MFQPIKNKKVYEHVIEQIQEMIMEGTLKKGDKLPSERELTEQLGVSRTSIREALRSLEIIGLIESKQGEGNFIKGDLDKVFMEPLSLMFMLNKDNPEDILELRMAIELEAAFLAAERITDSDIDELKILLDKLKETKDETQRAKLDTQFHYKIAKITGNFFIIHLLSSISKLMESFIAFARDVILEGIDDKLLINKQHQALFDSLRKKDPQGAYQAMRQHLELINKYLKKQKSK